jgi:hypothetical protein
MSLHRYFPKDHGQAIAMNNVRTVVTEVIEFEIGGRLEFDFVGPLLSDAQGVPESVNNWDWFQGAILGVVIGEPARQQVLGTACVIAPGLAVTAAHIFDGLLQHLSEGSLGISCFGIGSETADFWRVTSITCEASSEIAFLALARASAIDPKRPLRQFRLTTRRPNIGEILTFIGFQFPLVAPSLDSEGTNFVGQLLTSCGPTSQIYEAKRDNLLINFPAIEVECGAAGGMSGGALLDRDGYLIGVTSRSMETEDRLGPAYAAWIIAGLNFRVNVRWPSGLYEQNCPVLALNPAVVQIAGREYIERINDEQVIYRHWS